MDTFFTSNNSAVVNMNYRLGTTYTCADQLNDIESVMDAISKNAESWKINANRICMLGKSSGSQLALLYAYSRNQDRRIKAVIDGYGPVNFVDTSASAASIASLIAAWLGPFPLDSVLWHDSSPVFYMSGAVPTVIIQGTNDNVVHPIQSEMLEDSLLNREVPFLYIPWVGNGHGWDQVKWNETKAPIWAWVKNYL